VPAATSVANRQQAGNISRFVLQNGMIVIISEQHATPLAAVAACFRASPPGAVTGDRRLRGLVQQAVIAGGTGTRRPGQIYGDVRALGATMSGEASYDADYFLTVAPAEKIKDSLAIQSDMLQHAVLPQEEINRAAQLLSMEEASRCDEPPAYAVDRLVDLAIYGGPAGVESAQPSRTSRDLASITRDQVTRFYQESYKPANLVIAVAGDVSTFDVLVAIERLYSEFGTSLTNAAAAQVEPRQAEPRSADRRKLSYAEERADISQSIVTLGYPVLDYDGRDVPAMEVLAALIGQGRGSLLNRRLLFSQGVASRVESDYISLAGSGLLLLRM